MSDETTPVEGAPIAAPVEETETKQAETAEPETVEQTPEENEAEKAEKKRGAAKRIDELTRNWRSAERDRDYWREQAAKAQPAPKDDEKPNLEKFNFDQDAYQDALLDWKVQQKLQALEQGRTQATERQKAEQVQAEFRSVLDKTADKYDDFSEVAFDPKLPMPDHVVKAAMELGENAGEVLYSLAKNPSKAAEIAAMSPYRAAIALGRIEAQLTTKAPAPQISKAPPPPSAVGNRSTVSTDPMKLNADDWARQRNQEIADRHKRR